MDVHENNRKNEDLSDALDLYNYNQEQKMKKTEGLYNYIQSITPNEAIIYISVIIVITILIVRISPSPIQLVGILCGIGVVYYIISKRDTTLNDYTIAEEKKLLSPQLRDTNFFYMDTDLIDLFYDLGDYQFYSNTKFKEVIKHIDNFLHLQTDIENNVHNKGQVYDVMIELKARILNDFHAMVYDLPPQKEIIDRYQCATTKLHLLINQHLDECRALIKELDGSLPHDLYPPNYPSGNDPMVNPHYDLY
jgi:hypothetical protein